MSTLRANRIENEKGHLMMSSDGRQCVKFTQYRTASESAQSNGANVVFWNAGNVTKTYGSTVSTLFVEANLNGCNRQSGNCGTYVQVGGVRSYDFTYQYNNWNPGGTVTVVGLMEVTTLGAGSHAITAGWSPNNGSSSERPFAYFCGGDGRDDSRRYQQTAVIHVWEVLL